MPKITNGRNTLDAKSMFIERTKYKETAFQDALYQPIRNLSIGTLDQNGLVVLPREDKMRTISTQLANDVLMLDPIADAYVDMVYYFNTLLANNKGSQRPGAIDRMYARRGYQNISKRYDQYLETVYSVFFNTQNIKRDLTNVLSFSQFVKPFLNFLLDTARAQPVTKTEYTYRQLAGPFPSSLYLATSEPRNSEDRYKIKELLNNPNFKMFQDAAQRHGFAVLDNAPGILVAQPMAEYIRRILANDYGVQNIQAFFDVFFFYPHLNEVQNIKWFFLNSYLSLLDTNPSFSDPYYSMGEVKACFKNRRLPDLDALENQYDALFWVDTLTQIRVQERSHERAGLRHRVNKIAQSAGITNALNLLERQIR